MSENHLLERGLTGLHIRPGKQVKTAAALSVLLTAAVFSQAARAEEDAASSGADAAYASVSEAEEAEAASEAIETEAAGAEAASTAAADISSGEDASAAETVPTELDGGNFEDCRISIMFLFLSRFYNLAVAFAVAAERSIDTIIYTLMPAVPENREPIGFHK